MFIILRELRVLVADSHLVGIESLAFGAKGRATKDLAGLNWLARVLCFDLGIDYFTPTPQDAKLYAAGKGNATKREVAQGVKEQWGFEFQKEDITDAFVIFQMAKSILTTDPTLTESQVRGLKRKKHIQEVKLRRASRQRLTSTSEIFTLAGGTSTSEKMGRALDTSHIGRTARTHT